MSCDRCRDVSVGLKGRSSSGLRGLNLMMVTAVCLNKKFHKTWFGFQKTFHSELVLQLQGFSPSSIWISKFSKSLICYDSIYSCIRCCWFRQVRKQDRPLWNLQTGLWLSCTEIHQPGTQCPVKEVILVSQITSGQALFLLIPVCLMYQAAVS